MLKGNKKVVRFVEQGAVKGNQRLPLLLDLVGGDLIQFALALSTSQPLPDQSRCPYLRPRAALGRWDASRVALRVSINHWAKRGRGAYGGD